MRATMLRPMMAQLRRRGYRCLALTYPTRKQTLHDSVAQHLPRIVEFADDAPLFAIGHSLLNNGNQPSLFQLLHGSRKSTDSW